MTDSSIDTTVKEIEKLLEKADVDTIEDFFENHKLLRVFHEKHGISKRENIVHDIIGQDNNLESYIPIKID